MRRFLKIITVFILPIGIILISMEVLLREVPNRYKLQNSYLLKNGYDIETLILGSSHTQFGVNPEYFSSNTFNMSNKSQTLEIDLGLLKAYDKQLSNLKHVVLRLSYATLFEQLSNSEENWRMKNYELYMGLDLSDDFRHNYETLSLSFNEGIDQLIDFYFHKNNPTQTTALGWGTEIMNSKESDIVSQGKTAAKRHTIPNSQFLNDNIQILREIISWCQQREVEVLLVSLPTHDGYYTNLDKEQLKTTLNIGQQMSKEFANCTYYNFLKDERFLTEDFYDGDHLNAKGATKISMILNTLLAH